jgi:broad specificity phosphatase PhoE
VARDAAEAGGLPRIDIAQRDMDVPLSDLGERQAAAIGRWFGEQPRAEQPTAILTSPYVRSSETARLVQAEAGLPEDEVAILVDERLRER